jgi:type VI secretion system secreted protein VgrG
VAEVFKANHSMLVTDDSYVKGTNICIEATDNITIKVGKSYIAIESSGIKISTTGDIELEAKGKIDAKATSNITIDGKANVTLKAGANAKVEAGAMADVKAGAIASVKGSMVNIN